MSRIKNLVFESGERYPILLDHNGVPDFWVTNYVTEILRPSHTQSSMANVISHLRHFHIWEEMNRRDILEDLRNSIFLTDQDIYSLRDHCLLDSRSIKQRNKKFSRKVVRFVASSTVSVKTMPTVSANHAANRITHIAEYLDFTARILLKRKLSDNSIFNALGNMKTSLIASKPRGKKSRGLSGDPDAKSPPPEVFERVMEISREDSEENPFKGRGVK